MKDKKPLISIITATHNRADYIIKLYKSLKKQSYNNFEWILGNDGSTDKTDKLIKSFIKEKKVKIKYVSSSLRIGKTKIDNILYPLVSGKYQCYCGSDDFFDKNALKNMSNLLKKIPKNIKYKFGGIATQCVDENYISQSFFENNIPKNNIFLTYEEYIDFIKGDCTNLECSKLFKKKKFKEVDFLISESTLYNKIFKKKIILINPMITKFMRRAPDSISFGKKMKYNKGYAHSIAINENIAKFKKKKIINKFWIIVNYWRYCFHGDIRFNKAKKMWKVTNKNIFFCLLIPLSLILCIKDVMSKKVEKTHLEFEKNKNKAVIEYY